MKKKLVVVAILTASLCLGACGGSTSATYTADKEDFGAAEYAAEDSYAYTEEVAYSNDAAGAAAVKTENGDEESGSALRAQDGQKIVYTGNLSIQTLEYDKSAASIRSKIKAAGGFTESESEYNNDYNWYKYTSSSSDRTRGLNLKARIPSEKFDSFMNSLEGDGKIMNRSMTAENISRVYANKETYKKALEKEQERLLAMMDKAGTIEDMIMVESRLSEVERELNSYKTDLSEMDKDVEYSTIYIELKEVRRYTEEATTTTFGEEIRYAFEDAVSSFKDFCQGIILFVVRNFPYLIMLAIFLVLFFRWLARRKAEKIALLTNPEYAKVMTAKVQAKAEADARKRAEKEEKRRSRKGLFGRKGKEETPAEKPPVEEHSEEKPKEE